MMNLLPGLRYFSEQVFPLQQKHFEDLSHGQKPHTLLITCSDSRIDPNLVTQTKPGEIFIVRNSGNIVPPYGASRGGEEAAIEFAVDKLGVTNIVVCGHSQCGAMAAIANNANLEKMPAVQRWLDHAQSTKRRMADYPEGCDLHHVVEDNVLVQIDNLKTHPAVSAALRAGRVYIFAWVYSFESGSIAIYDPTEKRYILSTEFKEEIVKDAARFAL